MSIKPYNEPELRQWYCANECPLGKDCREIPEMPSERALIRLQNSIREMESVTRQISLIMEDGTLDDDEKDLVPKIRDQILEFRRRADETLAALERAEKLGKSFKEVNGVAEANIVSDVRIGNTRIKIADDYCKTTATEVNEILKRIAQQAQRHINAAAAVKA